MTRGDNAVIYSAKNVSLNRSFVKLNNIFHAQNVIHYNLSIIIDVIVSVKLWQNFQKLSFFLWQTK
jgi:hypothetical protein